MRAAIFIGIQASGKSSFYSKALEGMGYVQISMDLLHNRNREEALIRESIAADRNVAIDNTNPTRAERRSEERRVGKGSDTWISCPRRAVRSTGISSRAS